MVMHSEIITSEVRYILDQQIKDPGPMKGAFRHGATQVVPYFANLAATALALSGEPDTLQPVTDYVRWYLNSLNWPDLSSLHGTVYDYVHDCSGWRQRLTKPHPQHPGDPTKNVPHFYDSADSYAATFISLLRAYYHAGGNTALLTEFTHQIKIIAGLMADHLMDDSDCLTIAKPSHPVEYLMDNCEVYRGLADAAWLFEHVFQDASSAKHYQRWADLNRNGILTHLGNGDEFHVYKVGDERKPVDWEEWYPDVVSQLFPAAFGVISIDDPRAVRAFELMASNHPKWNDFDTLRPSPDAFPWAKVAYTAAKMGKLSDLDRYIESVKKKFLDTGHKWTWHPAEAGWLILACRRTEAFPAGW
jgi:hypothetical protein